MDAIILAAGKGTRLLPHTQTIPKPLLPVRGRPILDWIIGAMPPIDRLIVVVNYLAGQIEEYLATQTHIRDWNTVRQVEPRGTGDALMSCRAAVTSDRILVLNGDDLIGRADLGRLAAVPMGILARPVDNPESYGILFRHPDGSLARLVEKPRGLASPQLANIGAYLFPRHVFDLTLPLSPRNEYEITDAVAQLAAAGRFEVIEAGYWLPIGNVEQWQAAQTADVSAVTDPGTR
jgi:bifunctional UDP-N-acetylglucosamine pyrophosphorylase/glucosamine-1-phosphate N-acetyltransferase